MAPATQHRQHRQHGQRRKAPEGGAHTSHVMVLGLSIQPGMAAHAQQRHLIIRAPSLMSCSRSGLTNSSGHQPGPSGDARQRPAR